MLGSRLMQVSLMAGQETQSGMRISLEQRRANTDPIPELLRAILDQQASPQKQQTWTWQG